MNAARPRRGTRGAAVCLGVLGSACVTGSRSTLPDRLVATREPELAAAAAVTSTCLVGDPKAALGNVADRPSTAIVQELGTGLEAYRLQGGAWLAAAPVLVNEDFDFGAALGLGAIGAGLAAKQRADHNAIHARELAATRLSDSDRQALDALRACGLHRWALLWEGSNPVLHVVTDEYDLQGKLKRSAVVELPASAMASGELWRTPVVQAPDSTEKKP
jgi:hypothetical protein